MTVLLARGITSVPEAEIEEQFQIDDSRDPGIQLIEAAENGQVASMELLIKAKADTEARDHVRTLYTLV